MENKMPSMSEDEIIKDLEDSILNAKSVYCKFSLLKTYKLENALDLIGRLKADNEALIAGQETLQKALAEEIKRREIQADRLREERSQKYMQADMLCKMRTDLSKYKELADKISQLLERYSGVHKHADEARRNSDEYPDGTTSEMTSVWEVQSLTKHDMADYETMAELQKNIEYIAQDRLLSELEKDFRLLIKEMVDDANIATTTETEGVS